ncbi:uncharacterized protein KD926_009179 [Aspergillus affinis]|uniref:uncharacterized protein n=1 Tax=Aspergillus affinis TaxID=1070780 RepID=UPI0022FE9DFC|nr:uncharacterized protein KD926_009179 [Aspergillus affinis]KAI9039709.1 hypothetical protein KD926_009179 [Aspergillus affinis]
MSRIRDWLHRRVEKRITRQRWNKRPVSPPKSKFLPAQPPSTGKIDDYLVSHFSSSTFFKRLPPEIRRKIYVHAFGRRTYHMDFRYSGPDCRGTDPKFHAGIDFVANMSHDPETSESQEWRWWGSVCHRSPNQPWFYDSCRSGRGVCCTMPGVPAICRVGAMGWLLTCRQAHAETIDLLYSNIFYVESTVLLRFFPQLVPAPRLSRVTGLLLDLTLELFDDRLVGTARDRIEGWPAFDQITSVLGSGTFGELRELSISIYDYTPKSDPLSSKELATLERLLNNFDWLLPRIGSDFQKLEISITAPLYTSARQITARDDGSAHDTSETASSTRFWRPVLPPRHIEIPEVTSRGFGYWISRGKEEPHWFHQTNCFGS